MTPGPRATRPPRPEAAAAMRPLALAFLLLLFPALSRADLASVRYNGLDYVSWTRARRDSGFASSAWCRPRW